MASNSNDPNKVPMTPPKMEEMPTIKLATDRKQRIMYDNLADLYSIILAIEHLEKAYVRDSIDNTAYSKACTKLIAQYKTLQASVEDHVPDLETFVAEYDMECKAAVNRIKTGVPATVMHGGTDKSDSDRKGEEIVFHVVQSFITLMDSVKLGQVANDELFPLMTEVLDSLNKIDNLPPDHVSKTKTKEWILTLNGMKAFEELDEDQARQMSFDLDVAYQAYHQFVQSKGK